MALTEEQNNQIKDYLIERIRNKLAIYNPETNSMPFHYHLLGRDRMALFSFIQSVNTMLGQSIFEKVGAIISKPMANQVKDQYPLEGFISNEAVLKIDLIMRDLRAAKRTSDKVIETQEILAVANKGELGRKIKKTVDLFVLQKNGEELYFELKSAKPNINEFTGVKKQLLDWIAMRGSNHPTAKIKTIVAIPYNPYEPEPYERWTLQGLFDLKNEVLVGQEFWDLLGGKGAYEDLLGCFEQAGIELQPEIDKYFAKFK